MFRKSNLLLPVLLLFTASVFAHGGIDDDDSNPRNSTLTAHPPNTSLAFGLVALACACSALGSFLPFLDVILSKFSSRFANFTITKSNAFVASLLAFAAGIMSFLSLADLYPEAISSWAHAGFVDKRFAGLIVFAIMLAVFGIILALKRIFPQHEHKHDDWNEKASLPVSNPEQAKDFYQMGIQVAVALAIHNIPEGLATYALAVTSSKIGVIYGIALALHKIPEGMIIALPIYAASKSRMKAFLFAVVMVTFTQVLGAILGYVLSVTYWNTAVSGTLFAVAVALLVWVVYGGMIPMARSLDAMDAWTTKGLIMGVLFFALVNSLFALAE